MCLSFFKIQVHFGCLNVILKGVLIPFFNKVCRLPLIWSARQICDKSDKVMLAWLSHSQQSEAYISSLCVYFIFPWSSLLFRRLLSSLEWHTTLWTPDSATILCCFRTIVSIINTFQSQILILESVSSVSHCHSLTSYNRFLFPTLFDPPPHTPLPQFHPFFGELQGCFGCWRMILAQGYSRCAQKGAHLMEVSNHQKTPHSHTWGGKRT